MTSKSTPEQRRYQAFSHELTQPNGKPTHISQSLCRAARLWPHKVALIGKQERVTFRELYARSCRLSKQLLDLGVKPNDRVVTWCPNGIAFYVSYFAVLQVGALVAPANTMLHAREIELILKDSQASILIATKDKFAILQKYNIKCPTTIDADDWNQDSNGINTAPIPPKLQLYPEVPVVILYTSGTTGKPKGVMLSSKNILTNVLQGVARMNPTRSERLCAILPLFHSFAQNSCVWTPILFGATVIVCPRIDRTSLRWALDLQPTAFLGVPALYGLMCKMLTLKLNSIRYFICGGDALPDKIRMAFAMIYGRQLLNGYGMTEASPVIAVQNGTHVVAHGTVGTPCLGVQIAIKHEGVVAKQPHNTPGSILAKGDNIMLGYYNAQNETDKVIVDGWLHTGDQGFINKAGELVLAGRNKNLIIHKGLNIYPQEIENILQMHTNVMFAAVVGQATKDGDQIPVAFVQLADPDDDAQSTLTQLCKAHLAPYKIPRSITIVGRIPLTASGKVDKKTLVDKHLR
jgi:long-chain acyl-CoA synthetase